MARKARNEVAVGITVLAVLVLVFIIAVTLADRTILASKQKITVKLDYKKGLRGLINGSPVHS